MFLRHSWIAIIALSVIPLRAWAQAPAPARTVTLPLAEYNRLVDLSTATPTAAPVGSVLMNADLRIRVENARARGQFILGGEVLRDEVARVTLVSGATILGASSQGRAVPLVGDRKEHAALVQGRGPFSITLEWGSPVIVQPGRASFTLPVPPAGTTRASIDLPGEQADVRVSTGIVTRRVSAGGRTIVDVTLQPGTSTEVSWTLRDSVLPVQTVESRTSVDVLTLVTLAESDVRLTALLDVTVLQGEPGTFAAHIPSGYEVTSVSGNSLESSSEGEGTVTLRVTSPSERRHQFLIALERAHESGSFTFDTGLVTVPDAQRERGEIAIEGIGTLDVTAPETAGLHRLDTRELNRALQSLARTPLLAAFRYQRTATPTRLSIDVKRFQDAGVLAAVADTATATTMITAEGRALTEIELMIRNRAQPFLKLTLPAGASLASVEVGGEPVKPVTGADGIRVPLLRAGFRPQGPYVVSFVYLHAGTPFAKKGDLPMALARIDLPIALLQWELFVPDRYKVKVIDGNVIDRTIVEMFPTTYLEAPAALASVRANPATIVQLVEGPAGLIRGRVVDNSGSPLPGTSVDIVVAGTRRSVLADANGNYSVTDLPSGPVRITMSLMGFSTVATDFLFDRQARQIDASLPVGSLSETITVSGASRGRQEAQSQSASQNVINLQRRVSGVLPIRIDVPKAGTSHQFVKPLVVDQEAQVTFRYRSR